MFLASPTRNKHKTYAPTYDPRRVSVFTKVNSFLGSKIFLRTILVKFTDHKMSEDRTLWYPVLHAYSTCLHDDACFFFTLKSFLKITFELHPKIPRFGSTAKLFSVLQQVSLLEIVIRREIGVDKTFIND